MRLVEPARQCSMGLDLYVLSTPSATSLRRPEVTSYRKAYDGLGPDAAGRSGCSWGGGTSLSSRQPYRAGFDANYEPAYGHCRSPGSAAGGSRPMRDSERCNERNPS